MLFSNQRSLLATIWLKHRVPPHYSQQLAILKVQLHLLIKFLSYITGRRCFYMIFVHCSSVRDGQTSISFPRKTLNSFFINIYCKSVCFYIPLKTIYYVCQTYIAMKRLQRPIPCCKFPSEDSILFDIFTLLQSFQNNFENFALYIEYVVVYFYIARDEQRCVVTLWKLCIYLIYEPYCSIHDKLWFLIYPFENFAFSFIYEYITAAFVTSNAAFWYPHFKIKKKTALCERCSITHL